MITESTIKADVIFDHDDWTSHDIDAGLIARAADALWPHVSDSGQAAEMTVLLTDDARVRELNAQFREKDTATNVLSFPSGDDEYIGDIALAIETVAREATEQAVAVRDHVTHLVVHGTLHLLGYDHQTDDEAEEMEQLEVSILNKLGIADPYDRLKLSGVDTGGASAGQST